MGKEFESRIQENSKDSGIYVYRVKDTFIPAHLRMKIRVTKNKYDFLFYYRGKLIPSELKSTQSKSISYSESNPKIRKHQIEALTEDNLYEGVIPTLILNFREPANRAFIVHIDDFNNYVLAAQNKIERTLKGRHNEQSIPLHIVEQIGIEIKNVKKRTRYTYLIKNALDELIEKYGGE